MRSFRRSGSVLAVALSAPLCAGAQTPTRAPNWTAALHADYEAVRFLDASTLGRQLAASSFENASFQAHLALSLDRMLFGWLALGVALDARIGQWTRDTDGLGSGYHTLNAMLLVRPTLRLWGPGNRGMDGAIELGVGGGAALWTLRNEVETAPGYRLQAALLFAFVHRGIDFAMRFGFSYSHAGPLGPNALSSTDYGIFGGPGVTLRW